MTNNELIKATLAEYEVDEVILFGSRANQKADKYSDYDILAVFNSQLSRKEKMRIASASELQPVAPLTLRPPLSARHRDQFGGGAFVLINAPQTFLNNRCIHGVHA